MIVLEKFRNLFPINKQKTEIVNGKTMYLTQEQFGKINVVVKSTKNKLNEANDIINNVRPILELYKDNGHIKDGLTISFINDSEQPEVLGFATRDRKNIEVCAEDIHVLYHEIGHHIDYEKTTLESESEQFKKLTEYYFDEIKTYEDELFAYSKNQTLKILENRGIDLTIEETENIINHDWEEMKEYLYSSEEIYARYYAEHIRNILPDIPYSQPEYPNFYEQMAEFAYEKHPEIFEYYNEYFPELTGVAWNNLDKELTIRGESLEI